MGKMGITFNGLVASCRSNIIINSKRHPVGAILSFDVINVSKYLLAGRINLNIIKNIKLGGNPGYPR